MYKVIVAGGRDFSDYSLLCSTLHHLLSHESNVEIVSGMARGADSLAVQFASQYCFPVQKFPADWDRFGNSAGYKRNVEMAEYADACVCFWNGISKGTENMIKLAHQYKLQHRIIRY
jgi:hypothetical protein